MMNEWEDKGHKQHGPEWGALVVVLLQVIIQYVLPNWNSIKNLWK